MSTSSLSTDIIDQRKKKKNEDEETKDVNNNILFYSKNGQYSVGAEKPEAQQSSATKGGGCLANVCPTPRELALSDLLSLVQIDHDDMDHDSRELKSMSDDDGEEEGEEEDDKNHHLHLSEYHKDTSLTSLISLVSRLNSQSSKNTNQLPPLAIINGDIMHQHGKGHISPGPRRGLLQDCTHWCAPGITDVLVHVLISLITLYHGNETEFILSMKP